MDNAEGTKQPAANGDAGHPNADALSPDGLSPAMLALLDKVKALEAESREDRKVLEAKVAALEAEVRENRKEIKEEHADLETMKKLYSAKGSAGGEEVDPTVTQNLLQAGTEAYVLTESVWDAMLFLGRIRGSWEAVDMFFLGVLNILIQVFFCALLINLDLANTDADVFTNQIHDYIEWRIGVAHQAEHYDPLTNSSLAQRVCNEYGGTIQSRRHQSGLRISTRYYDYTQGGLAGNSLQGPGLLMLALSLWLAVIFREIVSILGFSKMVIALWWHGDRTTALHKDFDGDLELTSLHAMRALMLLLFVTTPRLVIAAWLCFLGIFYLRQTFGVEDIILNAMALGFVLEIDELLYHFLPAAARFAVTHMKSVPIELARPDKSSKNSRSRSIMYGLLSVCDRSRVLLIILMILSIVFRYVVVDDIQDSMEISQLILCDGNMNFVFKQHRATNIILVANTVDVEDELDLPVGDIPLVFDAVLQATGLCATLHSKEELTERLALCDGVDKGIWCEPCRRLLAIDQESRLYQEGALDETLSLIAATENEALSYLTCEDTYADLNQTFVPGPLAEKLAEVHADFEPRPCSEMQQHCLHPNTAIRRVVRIFCPRTCQCDALAATLDTWYYDRIGCAPSCRAEVEAKQTSFEDQLISGRQDCSDGDDNLPEAAWISYAEELQHDLVKRRLLVKVDGLYYASSSVRGNFAYKTSGDFRFFERNIIHESVRLWTADFPINIGGCSLREDMPIDIVAWARAAGSLCRWVRIIRYVFPVNLCSQTALLSDGFFGFNSLDTLCPRSCGLSVCSNHAPNGDYDADPNAAYNVLPWGQDASFNITCDREELNCVKVEKFGVQGHRWPGTIYIYTERHLGGFVTIYNGSILRTEGPMYEMDIVCLRPFHESACHSIHGPRYWHDDGYHGVRWRVTQLGSEQFLHLGGLVGSVFVCGRDWLNGGSGTTCLPGDDVTVMTPWSQMQIDAEVIAAQDSKVELPSVRSAFRLQGSESGMFAFRKATIQGGFDGTFVDIEYVDGLIGKSERVPLASLARPLFSSNPISRRAGHEFAGCFKDPRLQEVRRDPRVCAANLSRSLACARFVQDMPCASPVAAIAYWFREGGCENDIKDLADGSTVATLCPVACEKQAACGMWMLSTSDPFYENLGYGSYYSFKPTACTRRECLCKSQFWALMTCYPDLGFNNTPFFFGSGASNIYELSNNLYEWHATVSVMKADSHCDLTGFSGPWEGQLSNLTAWCFVDESCIGGSPSTRSWFDGLLGVDGVSDDIAPLLGSASTCKRRPASAEECSLQNPYPSWHCDRQFTQYWAGQYWCDYYFAGAP